MNGIDVHIISGTKNVWCRDWMPVQTPGGFVKFTYKGYGMLEKYPQLRVDEHCWGDFADAFRSDIILDGGNVVRWGDRVLMTDIVFTHNPGYDRTLLRDTLSDLLEAEIIFLPVEPGDTLGHTDGIVRWIDQGAVLLNYYLCMCGPEKVDY
jgi:agmatine deiminase